MGLPVNIKYEGTMLSKAKIKYIQTLGQKKHRDEEGVFIAEGPKIIAELMDAIPQRIRGIYAVKEWIDEHHALAGDISIEEVSQEELGRISQLSTPNKVFAIAEQLPTPENLITQGKIILALDTIQDPGNLGTLIRIADWFGIGQVACSPECADIYNPKVVQSTMGSIARVSVLYTDLIKWLHEHSGSAVYATSLEGRDISTVDKIREGIIIIGNESKGISPAITKLATIKLTIPRKGKAESLNAAVAAGIVLSHIC
jgi:TrmH family RNA methyltransferase